MCYEPTTTITTTITTTTDTVDLQLHRKGATGYRLQATVQATGLARPALCSSPDAAGGTDRVG